MCEELAACDTNTSAAVCWDPAPLLSESWFLLGGGGLRIPALPASQSCRGGSIQFSKHLPTPTRSLALCWVKLGTEIERPSHGPQDAQSNGEDVPDGGGSSESLTPKHLAEETKEDRNPKVRGQEGVAAVGPKGDAEMALGDWSSQGSVVQRGSVGKAGLDGSMANRRPPGEARPRRSGCIRAVTGSHEF